MSTFVRGLKCRLCGKTYPQEPLNFCTEDFGPLEVDYDYEAIARTLSREKLAARPNSMWRFRELLPIDGEPTVGSQVGGTPLVRASPVPTTKSIAYVRRLLSNTAGDSSTSIFDPSTPKAPSQSDSKSRSNSAGGRRNISWFRWPAAV